MAKLKAIKDGTLSAFGSHPYRNVRKGDVIDSSTVRPDFESSWLIPIEKADKMKPKPGIPGLKEPGQRKQLTSIPKRDDDGERLPAQMQKEKDDKESSAKEATTKAKGTGDTDVLG